MNFGERFYKQCCDELLKTIKEYDSDTFFAKGCDLTDEEAHELAGRCIHHFIDKQLDGVLLDEILAEIRDL
jgi:hypothetical protein